jgi:hypothetical protein
LWDSFCRTSITSRPLHARVAWFRDSSIPNPDQELCTFRLSLNSYSNFFNPPSRYYQRTAMPYTMHSTMSSRANTYRALVTLCTNRRATRLLKTVSPTHITLGECTIRGLNSPAARQAFGAPQNGPGRADSLESLIGYGRSSKNLDAC